MRLEMVASNRWVPIREAGGIVNVSRCIASPGQRELSADVQRVSLIMVEQLETVAEGEIGETAGNVAEPKGELIRVGQVDLRSIANVRRAQREFPAVDAGALDRDGKENVGIIQIVVIEKVIRTRQKIVGVESPTAKRNGDAKLMFFVPFTV